MEYRVYSLYDGKVQYFTSPFLARNKGEAIRVVLQVVRSGKSAVANYPEDFALMELGVFDENTGIIKSHVSPENLGLIFDWMPEEERSAHVKNVSRCPGGAS